MKRLREHLILFTLCLTGCCILLYFCIPYKEQVAGVMLGVGVSFYNVLFIERKLRNSEARATLSGYRSRGTGMLHRFSMIALAIMLAYRYPQFVDARMIVVGLPLCYIFLFVQQWFDVRKEVVS